MANSDSRPEYNYGGYSKEKILKRDSSGNKENNENMLDDNNYNVNSSLKAPKIKKEAENNNNISNQNFQNNLNGINMNCNGDESLNSNNFSFVPTKKKYVKKFAYKSQPGKNDNGLSKINQDNFLIMENILNNEEFRIFGVFDGHGKSIFCKIKIKELMVI